MAISLAVSALSNNSPFLGGLESDLALLKIFDIKDVFVV
jgi:hypothetical protein